MNTQINCTLPLIYPKNSTMLLEIDSKLPYVEWKLKGLATMNIIK